MSQARNPSFATLTSLVVARLELERSFGREILNTRPLPRHLSVPDPVVPQAIPEPASVQRVPLAEREELRAPEDAEPVAEVVFPTMTADVTSVAAACPDVGTAADEPSAPRHVGDEQRIQALAPLVQEALSCTKCGLCQSRKQVVFGEGAVDTDLLFVCEAPGKPEDDEGRPFAGVAGTMMTDIVEKGVGRPRMSVYMTSLVKCRPPGNRMGAPEEIAACLPYFREQLRIIQPRVIVAVGEAAAQFLTGSDACIDALRGTWGEFEGIPVMPIYHTMYLWRQRRKHGKGNEFSAQTWSDIQAVRKRLTSE